MKNLNLILLFSLCLCVGCRTAKSEHEPQGAVASGIYHNLFTEVCGIPNDLVQQRIDSLWNFYFTPGDFENFENERSIYYTVGDSLAFIFDTGSEDVRTEGMSYGMIISVQLDKRDVFDRLWNWSKKYMAFDQPEMDGYFCWHCLSDGSRLPGHNASDGEIYFATALLLAANRWNVPEYASEAVELLHKFYEKDPASGIYPLFDRESKAPCFVPNEEVHWFSDPSYALPAFLEIWSERDSVYSDFWAQAAGANRDLLISASHPVTGLFPDYCLMNGEPYAWPSAGYDTSRFMYDAIRCPMNIGMDAHLFAKDIDRQRAVIRRLLKFFEQQDYKNGYYNLDGTGADGALMEGAYGANAVGAFALLDSDDPEDQRLLKDAVWRFWNQPFPTGKWRYYNAMVYTLAMLHASGNFKVY